MLQGILCVTQMHLLPYLLTYFIVDKAIHTLCFAMRSLCWDNKRFQTACQLSSVALQPRSLVASDWSA